MVSPLDAFGIVTNAISIASALQGWIDGSGTDPDEAFRQNVNTKLTAIQNKLEGVAADVSYIAKLLDWSDYTKPLYAAESNIIQAWTLFDMDTYIANTKSPPPASLVLTNLDVQSLPGYLSTYDDYVTGKQPDPDPGPLGNSPLLEHYLNVVYQIPPAQRPPISPCEMAYYYWRRCVYAQVQAVLMYGIAYKQYNGTDKATKPTIIDWTLKGANKFKSQGEICQAVVTSHLAGASSNERDENIRSLCSVSPYAQPLTSHEINLNSYNAFYLADVSDSISQVPADEVLVSWGFRALPVTTSDILPQSSGCLLIPILYSGKFDPATGLVSPPPGKTGFTVTDFTENDTTFKSKCHAGRWFDQSSALQPGTSPHNNGIVQAGVDYFLFNDENGLRQRVYDSGGVTGFDQTFTTYWYAAYIGNINTSSPPPISDGEVLTGVTFEFPPKAAHFWTGSEGYDPDGPPGDPGGDYNYNNYVRLFIRVLPASVTGTSQNVEITSGQWVNSSQGGVDQDNNTSAEIVNYNQEPKPGDTMIKVAYATTRCVGADPTVESGSGGDALATSSAMSPLTGAGITVYIAPDGNTVVAPLNIYAYHVNKFNS